MAAEQQPAASWGADTDGRLNQSSEHLTEHAMLSTDASGNTVLVGGDGYSNYLPLTLAQCGIPMILPSSGSMADNGAITLTAALDRTYTSCYLYLPANAIYVGSAAGLWYAVMSSTTVGTVYDNAYATGQQTIPALPTPFVCTGPGAYTQTLAAITLASIPVPANSMGPNGELEIEHFWKCNNDASTKDMLIQFGGANFLGTGLASSVGGQFMEIIRNRGVTNQQVAANKSSTYAGFGASGSISQAVDTTVAQSLVIKATLSDATDYMILAAYRITLRPFQ